MYPMFFGIRLEYVVCIRHSRKVRFYKKVDSRFWTGLIIVQLSNITRSYRKKHEGLCNEKLEKILKYSNIRQWACEPTFFNRIIKYNINMCICK